MEINIDCSCGAQYQLDVQPVEGRTPSTVLCPHCGTDGTDAANEYLQLFGQQDSSSDPAPGTPLAGRQTPNTREITGSLTQSAPNRITRQYGAPRLILGTVGAVAAAFLSMLIWYLLIISTNTEFGIVAWGVGGLTGIGCRVLGGGYSPRLGLIAGFCAFLAIVGGEFLATHSAYSRFVDDYIGTAYQQRMAYAQQAVQAKTDDEVKALLMDDQAESPHPVTTDQIREFRTTELPELVEFVNGRPNQPEFEAMLRDVFNSVDVQASIFKASLSLWTLLWLFLGVGTAYRLGTGQIE